MKPKRISVGLISDTHGLLRDEALAALCGSDFIVHAGDIGDPAILDRLASIAPLTAVRGNNDRDARFEHVPETAELIAGDARIHVLHDLASLALDPQLAGVQVIVSGHSHKPHCEQRGGVWFVNPGSAGPRRFSLPISVGRIRIDDARIEAEWFELSMQA